MRRFLRALAFGALLAKPALAVTEAELVSRARKSPELRLYTYPLGHTRLLATEFRKKYPFIKINHVKYLPGEKPAKYLYSGRSASALADVIFWGEEPSFYREWLPTGWLAPLGDLPAWPRRPRARPGDDARFFRYLGSPHVLIYNRTLVKEEDLPRTFEELADAKWAGKVVVRDPDRASSALFFMEYMHALHGDFSWYERLGANHAFVAPFSFGVHALVNRGTYPLGVSRDVEVKTFPYLRNLASKVLDSKLPYESLLAMVNVRAPHPAAARLFANWLMSDGQRVLAAAGYSAGERQQADLRHPAGIWELPVSDDLEGNQRRMKAARDALESHGARMGADPFPDRRNF